MKHILCVALLAMILYPAECRAFGQEHGYGDQGEYGGPPAGRHGYGNQKASQGGILDMLSGLAQNLGLSKQSPQGGHQDMLAGLARLLGSGSEGGNGNSPLSGLLQKVLGSGDGLNGLLQGLGEKFSGKARRSGSPGGRRGGGQRKKSGSCGQGAESGRNGYGSDDGDGQEEFGRGGGKGGRRGRKSGYKR